MALSWRRWREEVDAAIADVDDDALRSVAALVARSRLAVTAGNGGSSSLAAHAAQAISKPDYAAGGGRAAICLTDNTPTLTAHANDGGWDGALSEVARPLFDSIPDVVLVAFSSSGRSENVCRLARLAAERGVPVVAFTGFSGEPLRSLATVSLHVRSESYEVVEPAHDALIHRMQYHLRDLRAGPP